MLDVRYSTKFKKDYKKIIGAVTAMSDNDAENFWNLIVKKYSASWDNIEEEAPDETDFRMLQAIKNDPECHEGELKK